MGDRFTSYRNHLPHWRLAGAIYFLTWRLHRTQPPLEPWERHTVVNAILHFRGTRYHLPGYVVMDDHVHALVQPTTGFTVQGIVASWKSFTAHRLVEAAGRRAPVWQREYHDRIVRGPAEMTQKLEYMMKNPFKRWPGLTEYPWMFPTPEHISSSGRDGRHTAGGRDGRTTRGGRDGRSTRGGRDGHPTNGGRDGRPTRGGRDGRPT